ncbi:retrovirus-related Pol polyprotein from transposon TNT 1-94 [Trifolium pratense]|uniref:Retrovirus-related Pol polyprotein from transposon TNT 1-94 n=1 Tax=Trifolium pratense TaxID=57577 RepID=A0A2K3LKV4_TRIPR|nr:retrovirus-related Pol polyprotein from transposon TNT 1-94 [Trifolium pratense]
MKGVILFDLHNKNIFVSINVTHYDHILPYNAPNTTFHWTYHAPHSDTSTNPPNNITNPLNLNDHISQPNFHTNNSHFDDDDDVPHTPPASPIQPDTELLAAQDTSELLDAQDTSASPPALPHDSNTSHNNPHTHIPTLRRSNRPSIKPSHVSDYLCNLSNSSCASTSPGTLYPISAFHSYSNISSNFEHYAMSITATIEPTDYKQASQRQCWIEAMKAEIISALQQNKTWTFVDPPAHIKPIGSKWVYKVKHKADGTIERYKARLVAKGYKAS